MEIWRAACVSKRVELESHHASVKGRLLVFNRMFAGKHSLVQDSADKDAIAIHSIKNDMPLMLDAAVSWPNPIAGAADSRSFDTSNEARFQTIQIAISLLFAPGIHGVICNIDQIDSSQLR